MTTYGRPGVYISETLLPAPIAVTGTANAAGAALGEFAQGPETVTLVTSWYEFVKQFGGYNAAFPATFGVAMFFQNGGSELYVKRVLNSTAAKAQIVIPSTTEGTNAALVKAKNKGADGNNLRVQFTPGLTSGLFDLTVYKEGGASSTSMDITNDVVVERYTNLSLKEANSSDFADTVVNFASQYIEITVTANNDKDPVTTVLPLAAGNNGTAATKSDYSSAVTDFSIVDRPLIVFVPEINKVLPSDADEVLDTVISWAQSNNGFAVVDTAANLDVNAAVTFITGRQSSSNAAGYYPHLYIADPLGRSAQSLRKVGPAGAVAGLYINTDKSVGPFKAPAGVNATVRGAIALERGFTPGELDFMNSGSTPVNAIRNLPGSGISVMGARTLKNDGTANKYVNTRRSLIFVRKSLNDLTQFALFENNDERLWARIRTSVNVFLTSYYSQGGLRGTSAAQAFYVKCDAENNSGDSIASGEVHIEIGVALQYPAEFVVINLSQKTAA